MTPEQELRKIARIAEDPEGSILELSDKVEELDDKLNEKIDSLTNEVGQEIDNLDERIKEESKKDLNLSLNFAGEKLDSIKKSVDDLKDDGKDKRHEKICNYLEEIRDRLSEDNNNQDVVSAINELRRVLKLDVNLTPLLDKLDKFDFSSYTSSDKRVNVKLSKEQIKELKDALGRRGDTIIGSSRFSDERGVPYSASNPVPITGSITVDTTGLAQESGGNLDALVAKDFATETTLAQVLGEIQTALINLASIDTNINTIDGKVSTEAKQDDIITELQAQQTDALTDDELRANPVPISGTVTANLSATDNAVLDDIASDTEEIKLNTAASTPYKNIDVDESGDLVITGAKTLTGYFIHNKSASTVYVKFYNKSTAPTVGTDTPVQVYAIPAGSSANRTCNMAFSLGIGVGATTGVADSDTGAPAANDVVVSLDYK